MGTPHTHARGSAIRAHREILRFCIDPKLSLMVRGHAAASVCPSSFAGERWRPVADAPVRAPRRPKPRAWQVRLESPCMCGDVRAESRSVRVTNGTLQGEARSAGLRCEPLLRCGAQRRLSKLAPRATAPAILRATCPGRLSRGDPHQPISSARGLAKSCAMAACCSNVG